MEVFEDHLCSAVAFAHVETHVACLGKLSAADLALEGLDAFVRHDVVSRVAALHKGPAANIASQLSVHPASLVVHVQHFFKVLVNQLLHLGVVKVVELVVVLLLTFLRIVLMLA